VGAVVDADGTWGRKCGDAVRDVVLDRDLERAEVARRPSVDDEGGEGTRSGPRQRIGVVVEAVVDAEEGRGDRACRDARAVAAERNGRRGRPCRGCAGSEEEAGQEGPLLERRAETWDVEGGVVRGGDRTTEDDAQVCARDGDGGRAGALVEVPLLVEPLPAENPRDG